MASKPLARLKELLNEGQEPFKLESYLLERQFQQRDSPHVSSEEIVKQSGRTDLNKRVSRPPKFLRAFYNKFLAINNLLKINTCDASSGTSGSSRTETDQQESSEQERITALDDSATEETIASLSFTTESSDSRRPEEKRTDEEMSMDRNFQQDFMEEAGKQHSPVSVLEDIFSQPPDNQEEVQEMIRKAPLMFLRSKKIIQQKKQLMLDFVREAMQKNQRENCNNNNIMGFEEIGKFIYEKMEVGCGNKSGDWNNNIEKFLELDLVDEEHKWYEISSVRKDIALEIGDLILEEMKHEAVLQLISFMTQQRTCAT